MALRKSKDTVAVISKEAVNDNRLTWTEKGIYAFIVCNDGYVTTEKIINNTDCDKNDVANCIDNLKKYGYISISNK